MENEPEFELDITKLEAETDENPYTAKFKGFFEGGYLKEIEKLANQWPHRKSIEVDYKDLERFDFQIADELLEHPDLLLEAAEFAVQQINVPAFDLKEFKPHVRFFNLPRDATPYLRNVGSEHLSKLICVEGLVRQVTDVLPKLRIAAWQCRRCANIYKKEQESDKISQPMMCECRHREFVLIPDQSIFMDSQKILVQEPLELLKGSEQATNFEVIVTDDLVNKILPGDRTKITGVLRLKTPKEKGLVYQRFLEAIHLDETQKEFDEILSSPEEVDAIKTLATNPKVYDMLIQSIAPNIYGHSDLKEAIALQLFGGITKVLPNDSKIRGNIHVLLVGDPGCLVADERVALGNGAIDKIGNMGVHHLQEIDTQVLTGEGGSKRDLATVFHTYKSQRVMEIVTESGKSIKGTPNHPLLCVSKADGHVKRSWKRLDEFRLGDRVATVTRIPCTIKAPIATGFIQLPPKNGPKVRGKLPDKMTPELAGFLGYAIGDGWATKYRVGFVVNEEEKDLLPKLLDASEHQFGIRPTPRQRKLAGRKMMLYYSELNSADVAQNLSFLREKRIPDLVLKSGNAVAAEFLKWLFEADGCCFCKGRGRRAVSLKAKNIELLRDVQMLLLRFGVHARITANALQIRRGKDILSFSKHIGFVSEKKKAKMQELAKQAMEFKRFNSQRSEEIVKIIQHAPEDVFDIEVPAGHRFIANGIVSHNTAKSQLLQSVNKIAPKSVYVAGKTSSGVGLTAAAVKDDFGEGGWTLKAGALVLANGGMAMIDEFDKMEPEDRSAMHEAMEQGMISIAKAGIVTRLKTETTILAAANPKFSRFDQFKNFFEQIDLPPTLISRFDLFFMIRDVLDRKRDEELASHILKIHQTGAILRQRKSGHQYNVDPTNENTLMITPQIDSTLLKKFIAYARQNVFPVLTKEAIQSISEYYVNLREQGKKEGTYSATHRQLEGLVRLSEASARIRLSNTVDEQDAQRAIRLLRTSLQELVTDKETGRIDIDMITSGQTANQTQQLKTILNIVQSLAQVHDKVLIEQVLEDAKTAGIDKEKTREIIGKLKRTGELYEPSHGVLKPVNQRE
ncbi:MAG: LAGLIDADG family homing endonuclease [Candidatus Diapherotrites archaeon]|nr:LAGLIDADG family homing endonuclease [Candidatus Diapherotrites archaeon]